MGLVRFCTLAAPSGDRFVSITGPVQILANGIEFPLVVFWGFVYFVPLTLLVALVEGVVFHRILKVGIGDVFNRLFWTNAISALAGGIVYSFQDVVVELSGIVSSIPRFISGYRWVALLLITIYFAKSILIEGYVMTRSRFAQRIERPRPSLWRTVILANVASYCITGPLFYFVTRPSIGPVQAVDETKWTANPGLHAYYIDNKDHFIRRIKLDGTDSKVVVPHAVADFLVSHDETAFAFRGQDGFLYVQIHESEKPVCIWKTKEHFFMQSVSLSPDKSQIAVVEGDGFYVEKGEWHKLRVYETRGATLQTELSYESRVSFEHRPFVSWSRDGKQIYITKDGDQVATIQTGPTCKIVSQASVKSCGVLPLVDNYVQWSTGHWGGGDDWGPLLDKDTFKNLSVSCYRGLGAQVRVTRDGASILVLPYRYGFLNFGFLAGFEAPTFLPQCSEILLECWRQLYLLDVTNSRFGFLVDGYRYVLPTPRFQIRFSTI